MKSAVVLRAHDEQWNPTT